MSDNPLVNLEGITKPVSDLGIALIEKIASAGYILYKPTHIKRVTKANTKAEEITAKSQIEVAKAKAEVAKIQAESKIEITASQRRAVQRWIAVQGQQQESIENTIAKAIPQLNEDADPYAIDNDWIIKFFDKSRLVTDDKMQDLWASILAGEANSVGSYSPKTLTTVADMNKKVAMLFKIFCSLCIVNSNDPSESTKPLRDLKVIDARLPIIRDVPTDIKTVRSVTGHLPAEFAQESKSLYEKYGLGFNEFQLLLEHGLIQDSTPKTYKSFRYNNEIFGIIKPSLPGISREITISGYYLSYTGQELFHITKCDNPEGYFRLLIDFLEKYYDVKIKKYLF